MFTLEKYNDLILSTFRKAALLQVKESSSAQRVILQKGLADFSNVSLGAMKPITVRPMMTSFLPPSSACQEAFPDRLLLELRVFERRSSQRLCMDLNPWVLGSTTFEAVSH